MNELAGYVTDVPYVYGFKPMLAPAWLDLVAIIGGVTPPARDRGFAWCDLGCGQGVSAAILAATHPTGSFYGIDAMPAHIEHAARLAGEADASNAHFHAADFAAARALPLPRFDYIVAHGVYSWVDRPVRVQLRRLIDGHLKSGGLVYVSYNALPGWTGDLPFQHLARELAADLPGDSAARFAGAAAILGKLAEAGAPSLASSYLVDELRERPADYRPGYLVHEFMHAGWQPLYVTELRRDLKEIGLVPVGSALLAENFDRWMLGRRARALVAGIADPDRRELVRDFCMHQRFRCDVFARAARAGGAAAAAAGGGSRAGASPGGDHLRDAHPGRQGAVRESSSTGDHRLIDVRHPPLGRYPERLCSAPRPDRQHAGLCAPPAMCGQSRQQGFPSAR